MDAFFLAFVDDIRGYLLVVVATGFAYWLLVRPSTVSVTDPWAIQQVLSAFASAAVLFMGLKGVIRPDVVLYHVTTTAMFFLVAAVIFQTRLAQVRWVTDVSNGEVRTLKRQVLALFVVAQIAAWLTAGVPLLMASRLDSFAGGSGVGVLSRLISFTSVALLYLLVLEIGLRREPRIRLSDVAIVGFSIMASVLNGSKSNIVFAIVFVLASDWLCRMLYASYQSPRLGRRSIVIMFSTVLGLALLPFAFESGSGSESAEGRLGLLTQAMIRLVLSGDGYMWFYGDQYLDVFPVREPASLLFADFLGMTRLISWDALPVHPGLQVFRDIYPDNDSIRGPNLRLDTFGLLFGGPLPGLLFCIAAGAVFAFARTLVFRARLLVTQVTGAFLFLNAPTILVDPVLGVTMFVNAGLGLTLVCLLSLSTGGQGALLRGRLRRTVPPHLLSRPKSLHFGPPEACRH